MTNFSRSVTRPSWIIRFGRWWMMADGPWFRRPSHRRGDDLGRALRAQCPCRSSERRAGRDNVVDHQDAPGARSRSKADVPAGLAGAPRLRGSGEPAEQGPSRYSEPSRDRSREQRRVVDAPCASAPTSRRRPGHEVDCRRIRLGLASTHREHGDDGVREPGDRGPSTAVLDSRYQVGSDSLVGERSDAPVEPVGSRERLRRLQATCTVRTDRVRARPATGTPHREQERERHVPTLRRGCDSSLRPSRRPCARSLRPRHRNTPVGGLSTGSARACTDPRPGHRDSRTAPRSARSAVRRACRGASARPPRRDASAACRRGARRSRCV